MKGYGMIKVGQAGWLEKEKPVAWPYDAIIKPIAVAPCSSDTHAMHGGTGEMNNVILGHEAVGEVAEVGSSVTKFKVGDRRIYMDLECLMLLSILDFVLVEHTV